MFDIANFIFSVKNPLAAPKIMYLDTYNIFFNELTYARSVNGNNKNEEGTVTIT